MSVLRSLASACPAALRRESPWLVLAVALLVVLLHANAPEVWFWFAALLVLLLWRSLACRGRWRDAAEEVGVSGDQG
jgi:Ca2+/Na+ antiporter